MTDKATLRKEYLEKRRALSPADAIARSHVIRERLLEFAPFRAARVFTVYVSSMDNEVDTHGIIEWLLASGRTVLVPISLKGGLMMWSRLRHLNELQRSKFGILEPSPDHIRPANPPADALVLVPGIAFTRDGYRIGYGAGYYDRYLAGAHGLAVALAYDLQLIDSIPRQSYDQPVDVLITETETVLCRQARKP